MQTNSSETENQSSKKRKLGERVVVAVKIEESGKKQQRSEGPPDDSWSWRKYGQKPIKGSPYPRGYYRCSTSKGCSAKKQVERSKTDASMLIITYTSTHNHPGPDIPNHQQKGPTHIQDPRIEEKQQDLNSQEAPVMNTQSPLSSISDQIMVVVEEDSNANNQENLETQSGLELGLVNIELPSEENDFYDELEELPTPSYYTAFMRNSFGEEGILLNPNPS